MRIKTWYALPVASVVVVAAIMAGLFDETQQQIPVEPPASKTSNVAAPDAVGQTVPAEVDSAAVAVTKPPSPADESMERQELTAQLQQAGAEKHEGLAPKLHIMTSPPMAGSHLTAPDRNIKNN